MILLRQALVAALAVALAACDSTTGTTIDPPPLPSSLDAQLRQEIGTWGVVPILPVNAANPALVDLGRMLFFDKVLSGNRDVSCASCHSPLANTGDALSLAIGTGAIASNGTRQLGVGRAFTPRNAPPLFSVGLGAFYLFWDGRLAQGFGVNPLQPPNGIILPPGLDNVVAAQAMIPVTNRVEMRGNAGDHDVFGNVNELAQIPDTANSAIWAAVMQRVLAIADYKARFNAAFPGFPAGFVFQNAANAIAAFEAASFSKTNSPFDRYLARDDNALSTDAKKGALLFFGRATCSQCHNGPLLGGQSFANAGVPQLGPGNGKDAPLDGGREDFLPQGAKPQFLFRVPPLRNVELTAPYMHDGAYATLEAVVSHYNNVDSAIKAFNVSDLDAAYWSSYHGDATTINQVLSTLDPRLRQSLKLSPDEQRQIVAFLKSLTDPAARDLSSLVPSAVPSGLPVR